MKTKFITLSIGIFIFPLMLLAQRPKTELSTIYIIKSKSSDKELITRNLILNLSQIASMKLLDRNEVQTRFGKNEALVAFYIIPKPNAKIKTLTEFYEAHNVSNAKRNLPLKIDGKQFSSSSDVLIDENSIKSLTAGTDSIVVRTSNRDELIEAKRKAKGVQ